MQAEQEFVLLIKYHLAALQGKHGMPDDMTMTDALQHLLSLIQQQEQIGEQQNSISSLQVCQCTFACSKHMMQACAAATACNSATSCSQPGHTT